MKRALILMMVFSILTVSCRMNNLLSTSPATPASNMPAQPALPTASAFDLANLGSTRKDITYCRMNGTALKMDVYYPDQYSLEPWPAVMYVHGGAWQKGDKSEGAGFRSLAGLRSAGFIVFAINYRLAPQYLFPAQIEDVKCAVRYLRAHAEQYHLNSEKIGVWGGSAGGHLVALLGTSNGVSKWEVGDYLDQSSDVQAVVDMFGPADLSVEFDSTNFQTARDVFGVTSPKDPKLAIASPVTYIDAGDPPFLILHGDQDAVVPLEQSQILFHELQAAGVQSQLVVVQGAGHGFARAGNLPISPSQIEINQQIIDFFVRQFKLK
jgi:acetyl esterase/lipase